MSPLRLEMAPRVAAKRLGISLAAVLDAIDNGPLVAFETKHGLRIRPDDLNRYRKHVATKQKTKRGAR